MMKYSKILFAVLMLSVAAPIPVRAEISLKGLFWCTFASFLLLNDTKKEIKKSYKVANKKYTKSLADALEIVKKENENLEIPAGWSENLPIADFVMSADFPHLNVFARLGALSVGTAIDAVCDWKTQVVYSITISLLFWRHIKKTYKKTNEAQKKDAELKKEPVKDLTFNEFMSSKDHFSLPLTSLWLMALCWELGDCFKELKKQGWVE